MISTVKHNESNRKHIISPPFAVPFQAPKVKKKKESIKIPDTFSLYLRQIGRFKLLTRDEEKALGKRIQVGEDHAAAYHLVTSNLRLVVKISMEFQRVWLQNLMDLIQEGNIGLIHAAMKYDAEKNVKFSYYASFWIKAYILKFIMDNWRLVRIGTTQNQRKLFFKLKKEKDALVREGFKPSAKRLSKRLNISEKDIVEMDQRLENHDVSIDAPINDTSDTKFLNFLKDDTVSIEERLAKKEIEHLLHTKVAKFRRDLKERELEIFDQRIFAEQPATLQNIGKQFGISRERVRQLEKAILVSLRRFMKNEIPDFDVYAHKMVG